MLLYSVDYRPMILFFWAIHITGKQHLLTLTIITRNIGRTCEIEIAPSADTKFENLTYSACQISQPRPNVKDSSTPSYLSPTKIFQSLPL